MTYKQALNFDQKWTALQAFNDLERYLLRKEKPAMKAVAIGMQALEKQIPKKPIFNSEMFHFCPSCIEKNKTVSYDYLVDIGTKFCRRCGQSLDWSDYE